METFSFEQLSKAKAFRIAPKDSNYFALLFDHEKDKVDNVYVIEIFTRGGATPPNEHAAAHEFFYVLHGEGTASCGGRTMPIKKGDALLLRPGDSKLYTLTVMTPNEGFAELIRSGEPVQLDDEDLRVLSGA